MDLQYGGSYTGSGFTGQGPDAPTQTSSGGGGDIYSALINLGSTIYQSETARNNSKRTVKANKDLAEYSYSKDLEMWNRMNDYNNPLSQMQRFKDAGLNPNLMYGQGNGGNSTQMPKYNAPTVEYKYDAPNIAGVLSAYQDFSMRQAQINQTKAMTQNIEQRTVSEAINTNILGTKELRSKDEYEQYKYIAPYQNAILGRKANMADADAEMSWRKLYQMDNKDAILELDKRYRQGHIDTQALNQESIAADNLFKRYRNEWMKMGITSSDNVAIRAMVRMWNESGLDLTSLRGAAINQNRRMK